MTFVQGDKIYIPAVNPEEPFMLPDYIKIHYINKIENYAVCNYYKYVGITPDREEVRYKHIKEIKVSLIFLMELKQLYSIRDKGK